MSLHKGNVTELSHHDQNTTPLHPSNPISPICHTACIWPLTATTIFPISLHLTAPTFARPFPSHDFNTSNTTAILP